MIIITIARLPPENVILEPLAIGRLVNGPILHLDRFDGDLGGEARTQLVGHDQHQVGVRDQLHAERTLALAGVAVAQLALDGNGFAWKQGKI